MLKSLFRKTEPALIKPRVTVTRRPDGSILLANKITLDERSETLIDVLEHQARVRPDAPFLKERNGDGWGALTYRAFLGKVEQRARQMLASGEVGPDRPILIAAPNSIEHAITSFSAMYIGVPAASVSPAYAMMPAALPKLEKVLGVLNPGAAFIGTPSAFSPSLPMLSRVCKGGVYANTAEDGVRAFGDLPLASDAELEAARRSITSDTVAKVLFTSGSTGAPKGVINTHRMVCSNQRALSQLWPFLRAHPPVLVDWLPWSHTFGGNVCLNTALFNGGVFHIDDGKPTPALIGKTVENLQQISPTLHFNVPAGLEALVTELKADPELARRFFSRLDAVFVAAAALPQTVRDELSELGQMATGKAPTMLAGWGSTETAPFSTAVFYGTNRADTIGLPMPGTIVKLSPDQDKFGLSVKGPNVTPGYWNNPQATADAFDTEGFYQMGDAGAFVDPEKPEAGLRFDGRLSENFKLTSGTWVNVGMLRVKLVGRLGPFIIDVVVTGHNAEDLGLLLVPNAALAAEKFCSGKDERPFESDGFRAFIKEALSDHNRENPGSSTAIKRVAVVDRAPEIGRNEITDKGYINQRAMLESWADLVAVMHGQGPSVDPEHAILRL